MVFSPFPDPRLPPPLLPSLFLLLLDLLSPFPLRVLLLLRLLRALPQIRLQEAVQVPQDGRHLLPHRHRDEVLEEDQERRESERRRWGHGAVKIMLSFSLTQRAHAVFFLIILKIFLSPSRLSSYFPIILPAPLFPSLWDGGVLTAMPSRKRGGEYRKVGVGVTASDNLWVLEFSQEEGRRHCRNLVLLQPPSSLHRSFCPTFFPLWQHSSF